MKGTSLSMSFTVQIFNLPRGCIFGRFGLSWIWLDFNISGGPICTRTSAPGLSFLPPCRGIAIGASFDATNSTSMAQLP